MTGCKKDKLGVDYNGTKAWTMSGLECQRWDSQTPHKHKFTGQEENYCRNPDNHKGGPWCYTTNVDKRWESCDIPLCGKLITFFLFRAR